MKNHTLTDNLSYPLILDGGLSNALEEKGCDLNHKLWTAQTMISNPEAIVQSHMDYLRAGAQVITTSGYQASISGFTDLGFTDQGEIDDLIVKPVTLAQQAVDRYNEATGSNRNVLIAASIGPYGAYLADGSEYRGNYGLDDAVIKDFHKRRLELLDTSGPDFIAIETIPSYQEAKVLAALLAHCQTPTWLSFSCQDERHLNDGTPISKACELVKPIPSIFAIGVNCTAPQYISGLIRQIKTYAPTKKVVIYPNSGEIYNPKDKSWTGLSVPEDYGVQALKWVQEGADIIGGCCRIGPNHIHELSNSLTNPSASN